MKCHISIEENPNWDLDKESKYFFQSNRFLDSQIVSGDTLEYTLIKNQQIIARIVVRVLEGSAFSPYMAPFGFIEKFDNLDKESLTYFLNGVFTDLISREIETIEIRQMPDFYDEESVILIESILDSLMPMDKVMDFNQYLRISATPFKNHINPAKKSRLNNSIKQGYTFHEGDIHDLDPGFSLISEARLRKGFELSITLENLRRMFFKHPDYYKIFLLKNKDEIIAALIGIKVSDSIFYDFSHAEKETYLSESPVIALLEGVYRYCQTEDYKILDLGTSGSKGKLNDGVYTFKKELGGIESTKCSYSWNR